MRKSRWMIGGTAAVIAVIILAVTVAAFDDDRPIYNAAALPPVGSPVPQFEFPLLNGGTVSSASLRGNPAVLVLWSTGCAGSRQALQDIETLHAEYAPRGVRVVILAGNSAQELQTFADSARIRVEMAVAKGRLASIFDHSRTAPEADSFRVAFALPSTLVLDAQGRIAARHSRPTFNLVASSLDRSVGQRD